MSLSVEQQSLISETVHSMHTDASMSANVLARHSCSFHDCPPNRSAKSIAYRPARGSEHSGFGFPIHVGRSPDIRLTHILSLSSYSPTSFSSFLLTSKILFSLLGLSR